MRPGTLLRWAALKNLLKSEIKEDSVILDIGGYDGFISNNLTRLNSSIKITVVDVDKSGLQSARERGLNTCRASALELPIEDHQVDLVLCLDLIEHINEDQRLINEVSRVLKEGGKIILTTPMQDGVSFPFLNKKKIEMVNKSWGHVRSGYSIEDIEKLFENAGLGIEKVSKYFNLFSRVIYRFCFLSKIPIPGSGY